MNILRRIGVFILGALFSFLLFSLAFDYSVANIFTDPTKVKTILSDSKIYDTAVSAAFDELKKVDTDQGGSINFTDPGIKAAAEKSLTPAFLQQSTESVLDGLYGWLDGTTTRPEFRIDLSSVKATFAMDAGVAAAERVASLPACPPALSGANFDAFSATCLPGGLKPNTVATQIQRDIASSKIFLPESIITSDSIKSGQPGEDLFTDKLKAVPKAYQQIDKVLVALGMLALLIAAGIVFLSKTRRIGLRRAGYSLINAGVSILLLGFGLNYLAVHGNYSVNNILASQAQKLAAILSQNIKTLCLTFGGIYLGLGLVAIFGPMLYKKSDNDHDRGFGAEPEHEHHENHNAPSPTAEEQSHNPYKTPVEETKDKPKKSKKPVLIQ